MWFELFVYESGLISSEQLAHALRVQLSRRPLLGELALKTKLLSVRDVMKILAAQADQPVSQFGQLASELGIATNESIALLLMEQSRMTPDFGDILVELGYLTPYTLEKAREDYRVEHHAAASI